MYKTILFDIANEKATITINRPEVGNAFDQTTYAEIASALHICDEDASVRVVVITGNGKHFSAGGDINSFKANIDAGRALDRELIKNTGMMANAARTCSKPIIAMINGAAAGAGCGLALACDFRVMEESSKLVFAFINMAFPADTALAYLLREFVGMAKTTEFMALGSTVGGKEALGLTLTTRLAAPGKLQEETDKLAEELLNKPTLAIGQQKALYYEFYYRDLLAFNEMEATAMRKASMTEDHKEAVYAFLEKRKPNFKGK